MTQQHAASALLQAAIRSQTLSMKDALSLRHVLKGCDANPQEIRARLSAEPTSVPSETMSALLAMLPTPEQERVGAYQRLALLGSADIAHTWLGLHNDNLVVLKTLHPALVAGVNATAIGDDVRALLHGDYRYLVTYVGWEQSVDGACTLVQTYRAGRNVSERQSAKGEASEVRALTILRHAAKGLAQLHKLDRVHGNMQPKSILLDNDGRAALSDYALAATANTPRPGWSPAQLQRTAFAAPEELTEQPIVTPASDMYALGCIGYWLLCGQVPFPGTPERQALQHAGAERPDVRVLAAGVSEITAKTLMKAMQVDPAERYPNAFAFIASLERNLELLERPQADTEARIRGELSGAQAVSSLLLLEPDELTDSK